MFSPSAPAPFSAVAPGFLMILHRMNTRGGKSRNSSTCTGFALRFHGFRLCRQKLWFLSFKQNNTTVSRASVALSVDEFVRKCCLINYLRIFRWFSCKSQKTETSLWNRIPFHTVSHLWSGKNPKNFHTKSHLRFDAVEKEINNIMWMWLLNLDVFPEMCVVFWVVTVHTLMNY